MKLPAIGQFFARTLFRSVLSISLLAAVSSGAIAQKALTEGKDYRVLTPAQAVESTNKIEVIEFFWYGCPHCNLLEPVLNDWVKRQGPDVVVRRVPAAFNSAWVPHQRLYYTLDALGKETELRSKVFATIHVERNMLNTPDLMADWAARNGIDRKKFLDTYNSFSVQAKVQRAGQLTIAYGLDSVPTIAVSGKYTLNVTPENVGNIDYFVAKERALLKPVAAAEPVVPATAVAPARKTEAKKDVKKG